ncbi:DUF2126 domain-containing protein [Janibacter sp. G56]|uniref:transglutaminase family protein n=1 Tax=Janibacter sp. G56 TaxID=3418717 RepID=UPI003D03C51C
MALEHRTRYQFAHPVKVFPHTVRLRPAPHSRTPIDAYSLTVTPREHFLNWQQDPYGNWLARLVFPEPVSELEITVGVVADMTVINPFDFFVEEYAQTFPFTYPEGLRAELDPYLKPVDESGPGSGPGGLVTQWLADHRPTDGLPIVDYLVALNRSVQQDVNYTVRLETGVQSPDETLAANLGSCRDSAWLLVSVLRQLGLAARFVSGYLVQLTSDLPALPTADGTPGADGPAEDFTDLHAWAEVYVPGAGWIGLDATSGLFAGEGHIPLSATPHPSSAAPISGATAPVEVTFDFSNTVSRIHEDARVTKPYDEAQWQGVDALGHHVDGLLEAGDVRLTMGGEPTFVTAGDTSSAQWESAADGDEKRALARELAGRLKARWAPQGIIHHGQGKWYPGEPLPRWQMQLTWRADGQPLWTHQDLLDDPWSEGVDPTSADAEALARGVAARLGVPDDFCRPAFEDPIAALWEEARKPSGEERPEVDVDPRDEELAQASARRDKVAAFDRDPGDPRGWVVPIFRDEEADGWGTARWRTRREHLFLMSGTSPMGLRLPLSSIAWGEAPYEPDVSAFAPRPDLPPAAGLLAGIGPAAIRDIEDSPRTALAVEVRDGHLFAFMPPISSLDHALQLLAAVEAAAAEHGLRVVLEGYPLPGDPRLTSMSVTPDPGVIEVNVQPTSTWDDLRDLTTSLFEDARQTRLATEKFDVDGTHTGTGGGNHITLGGPRPQDSPLLRRPDLLRSLVTYWQNHPSLSYVFSGRFIGPTSQSPRVDEGRHETLYELEIAFAELSRVTGASDEQVAADIAADKDRDEPWEVRRERHQTSQLWLTDRLLRHLLTDITGNTHRSEFCVDKLYSPDSDRGRLGLLELRGFEMPPHPQMALVQALLVRTLVARFWDEPYEAPLVRWGTKLHDRFLLPAFAAADLREVVDELNEWLRGTGPGAPQFDRDWLEPFLEFRFPRLGETDVAGVHLELRQAVEPWHVLGEEVRQSGTSRYVDSSVEKVQVAASGLVAGRHVVTCNGVPLPMTAAVGTGWGTGVPDGAVGDNVMVAGVRYRAWAPPSALHPTIGVHSPLVFDVVDTWNQRSLGGFTYHVVHPGGRSYEDYPVNAAAAETRRGSRFHRIGHSTGKVDLSVSPHAAGPAGGGEYPCTVDLRRYSAGHR